MIRKVANKWKKQGHNQELKQDKVAILVKRKTRRFLWERRKIQFRKRKLILPVKESSAIVKLMKKCGTQWAWWNCKQGSCWECLR